MFAYKTGLVIGRFQTFHLGHYDIISQALNLCEEVILCIGSANESETERNPFSYSTRYQMLSTVFAKEKEAGRLIIIPLNDIGAGDTPKWGEFVLGTVEYSTGLYPDIIVSGKEQQRATWFNHGFAELYLPKVIDISATELRDLMIHDLKDKWSEYVPSQLVGMYDELRNQLLTVQNNTK